MARIHSADLLRQLFAVKLYTFHGRRSILLSLREKFGGTDDAT
jgi:hypothetical protein